MRELFRSGKLWWPLVFRAGLYFFIESLPGLAKGCHEFGEDAKKVNWWILAALVLEAFYHGFIGLRAYFDGSAQRLTDQIKGDTQIFHKTAP